MPPASHPSQRTGLAQDVPIRLTRSSLRQLRAERANARWSLATGVYIVRRALPKDTSRNHVRLDDFDPREVDCLRLGPTTRCLCDHTMAHHMPASFAEATCEPIPHTSPLGLPRGFRLAGCSVAGCTCKCFEFVPTFPEEIGEGWLARRPGFELASYRAKCECNHPSNEHDVANWNHCTVPGCSCRGWTPHYQCAACDGLARDHALVVESEQDRVQAGRPVGEDYIPFEELRGHIRGFR